MKTFTRSILALALLLTTQWAQAKTDITWFGHAAFKIVTPTGKVILIDPWITNPANKNGAADLASITKADLILISHGHADHVGNAVDLAKTTGAKLVSSFDLGSSLAKYLGYPEKQVGYDSQGNVGGSFELLGGEVTITITPANHGSNVTDEKGDIHPGGSPTGFIIKIKGGPTIYHTGDTGYFSEMAMLGKSQKIDVMLACIGDHFVMGPKQAAEAVKAVNPSQVVPMHFGTFPVLTGTPEAFSKELKGKMAAAKLTVMQIGQTISI
jgi:L-ascorbate metabolism protein UlaG (beta-lactamase superfamily)